MKHKLVVCIIVVFLILVVPNNVYSQNKNNFFFNIGSPTTPVFTQWSLGLGYERYLDEYFALNIWGDVAGHIITIADSSFGEDKKIEIDTLIHFRYYPFSARIGKPFAGIGMGYTYLSMTTSETKTSGFFALQCEIGWKFIRRQIFIQPWAGYNISFGKINYPAESSYIFGEMCKYGFINFGLSFGVIF
jgi:outer membrane protein W